MFKSFVIGGFECSTHRNLNRVRLDMVSLTKHDLYTLSDYQRLQQVDIHTTREGIRWHIIEQKRGQLDFTSVLPVIRAANVTNRQVLWDLMHYGCPDFIDILKPEFVKRFRTLAKAFLKFLNNETDAIPFIAPINEVSFFSWACGEVGYMHPYLYNRGYEVKKQLTRASIEAIEAIWLQNPRSRILNIDPSVHVIPYDTSEESKLEADTFNETQHQAREMLIGKIEPNLGGDEKYLDIIGVNYYPFNQWRHNELLNTEDVSKNDNYHVYKPFHLILEDLYRRYNRPMFISETGAEGEQRAPWMSYIFNQVNKARSAGVSIQGICWYPILDTLHWDNNRHCSNGLFDLAGETGERNIYQPLAAQLKRVKGINFRSPDK